MNRKKIILVVSSPSGGGKTTIVKRFLKNQPDFYYSISVTTRLRRQGEQNGVDYYFVTEARFKKLLSQKSFAEWALVHGHYYGTLRAQIEKQKKVLLDIDVQGAMQIKKVFPKSILIFILPPSLRELKKRLLKRHTDNPQEIKTRLKIAKKEMRYLKRYDYAVVNRDINQALREIDSIIEAERLKVEK